MSQPLNSGSADTRLPSLEQLPDNFMCRLDSFTAISVTGEEQFKYLQGQVTCDVNTLTDNNVLIGGHCDAKGKVLSVFRLFKHHESLMLFQTKETLEKSLTELKKFGVFAKVDIKEADLSFLSLVGNNAASLLKAQFGEAPDELTPTIHIKDTTLVYLAGNKRRYLIIDNKQQIEQLIAAFSLPLYTRSVWELLEINEGFPLLNENAIQEYVPQMLNLAVIGGISFKKGCYLGQETVARMQYLGKNKKTMALFHSEMSELPEHLSIEKQLGDNWRSAGDVLSHYLSDNGNYYCQAVVANDLDSSISIRFKDQTSSILSMMTLPYSTQTST